MIIIKKHRFIERFEVKSKAECQTHAPVGKLRTAGIDKEPLHTSRSMKGKTAPDNLPVFDCGKIIALVPTLDTVFQIPVDEITFFESFPCSVRIKKIAIMLFIEIEPSTIDR